MSAAAPPPPSEIAQITDPTLKATVEQHAREHAAKVAAEAARIEAEKMASGESVWCSGGGKEIIADSNVAVEGYTCFCTKRWTLKALKPEKKGDQHVAIIPRHKPVNKASSSTEAPPPPPPAPDAYAAGIAARNEVPPPPPAIEVEDEEDDAPPPLAPAPSVVAAPPPPPPVVTETGRQSYTENTVANAPRKNLTAYLAELADGRKIAVIAENLMAAFKILDVDGPDARAMTKLDGYLA